MKSLLHILVFCCLCIITQAQQNFDEAIRQGDEAFRKGQYKLAIKKYFAAEALEPAKKKTVKEKVEKVFDKTEALRIEAVHQKNRADIALAEAKKQTRIAQANYLISEAKSATETDPTLALRLAEQSLRAYLIPANEKEALKIYRENAFYKIAGQHKYPITAIAFAPDGRSVLTGSSDNTARLWDLKGNTLQEFKGHSSYVISVAFAPDGRAVLTGSWDNTARLWDLKGNTLQEFKGHSSPVYSIAFAPDGRAVLTGSWDNTARLWQIAPPPSEFLKTVNIEPLSPEQKKKYGIK